MKKNILLTGVLACLLFAFSGSICGAKEKGKGKAGKGGNGGKVRAECASIADAVKAKKTEIKSIQAEIKAKRQELKGNKQDKKKDKGDKKGKNNKKGKKGKGEKRGKGGKGKNVNPELAPLIAKKEQLKSELQALMSQLKECNTVYKGEGKKDKDEKDKSRKGKKAKDKGKNKGD